MVPLIRKETRVEDHIQTRTGEREGKEQEGGLVSAWTVQRLVNGWCREFTYSDFGLFAVQKICLRLVKLIFRRSNQ